MEHEPIVVELTDDQIAQIADGPVVLLPEPGIGKQYRFLAMDFEGRPVTVHVCEEDVPKPS